MNTDHTGSLECNDGFHHMAVMDIPKGTFICNVAGPIRQDRTRYTIQTGLTEHTDPLIPLRYTNHACDPTTKILFYWKPWRLVATRDIKKGEDITFDYHTFEYKMSEPFQCCCAAGSCKGKVQGFYYLSVEQKKEYDGSALSPVVKEHWESE
jgi:hypothetical protein